MTAPCPGRKPSGAVRLALAAALLFGAARPVTLLAATTQRVVADWRTGLGLYGFDPVAYFADAQPELGRSDLEYDFAGVIWRFRSEGNRAAFMERPDVYLPRFGGYDPLGIARGVATPGHPEQWLIVDGQLFLFHTAATRNQFAANPREIIAAAEAKWPEVESPLVP
jgi:hypothetical protein